MRFDKGTPEWIMLNDYFGLCKRFGEVKGDDEYWEELVRCADEFFKRNSATDKFTGIFARQLATAYVNTIEKYEKENRKEWENVKSR